MQNSNFNECVAGCGFQEKLDCEYCWQLSIVSQDFGVSNFCIQLTIVKFY